MKKIKMTFLITDAMCPAAIFTGVDGRAQRRIDKRMTDDQADWK